MKIVIRLQDKRKIHMKISSQDEIDDQSSKSLDPTDCIAIAVEVDIQK